MNTFLNQKRLRDYPRLFLAAMILTLIINLILHDGWLGGSKQMIGGDFIMLYSAGILFSEKPEQLYDFQLQGKIQQSLLAPTPFDGIMPFNYPPYVAWLIQPITKIPLAWALGLWTLLTLGFTALAVYLIHKYLISEKLKKSGLGFGQLLVITFSFFAFVEGVQVGQNHGLTLLLTSGILAAMITRHWFSAGILAGISIYKPQFAIGFLILWLVWKQWKALLAFIGVVSIWAGGFLVFRGPELYFDYLGKIPLLLKMLYLDGFGTYLEVTPYGLLISILPYSAWSTIVQFTQLLNIILIIGLATYSFWVRNKSIEFKIPAMMMAVIFPLVSAPHTLLHDLVIIIPLIALWTQLWPSQRLLNIVVIIYLMAFLLPMVNHLLNLPLLAIIPIGLLVWMIKLTIQFVKSSPIKSTS